MGSFCHRSSDWARFSHPTCGNCDHDAGHICFGRFAKVRAAGLGQRAGECSYRGRGRGIGTSGPLALCPRSLSTPVKILYVSQYFPPEMGAPAARAAELSMHWVDAGHDVTVLTGFPNHPTGVVPPEYRSQFWRFVKRRIWNGVKLIRTWLLPFPNRKPYERMLNYGSFFVSSAITGLFVSKPDVLIATSPQLLVALSGWWLAFVKRVPFIFEVRDLWPESLAAVGVGDGNSLLVRVLGKIAGFLYRRATCIVVVTAAFRVFLVVNWKVPAEKIFVVENGVETEKFCPQPDRDVKRKELGAEGKFLICYTGTMGLAHGLETLVEAAAILQ